jgi:cysteine synthase A
MGCHELLKEQMIFCGGSSGASYAAAKKYLKQHQVPADANALFICPDKGTAYLDTVYNDQWAREKSAQCMPLSKSLAL